ncbi:MAG: SHOCT domain-containing protein [Desulfobacteraceae bacterium]|nr:SHOCT domain-containing protein [Desulfobacteraceae bacterium]
MKLKKSDKEGLFKNIFIGYFILLLHVFLLAGIAIFVVFIKGVFSYLPWIMGGAALLLLFIGWLLYRRMQKSSSQISDMLSNAHMQDRNIEVSLLGGLAAFKINARQNTDLLLDNRGSETDSNTRLIETESDRAERKMFQLDDMLEKGLITKEEFEKARQTIIQE